jgi:hypothetical protein
MMGNYSSLQGTVLEFASIESYEIGTVADTSRFKHLPNIFSF